MTIKTLFIAPYPAMSHLIEECRKEEPELEVRVEVGNLLEAVPLAKEGERLGYDVIISRGGTAKLIEPEVRIPVIDVHVSGYDMLRVLTLANHFPGKKAIVGFSNITLGAKAITDVLDIEVDVFTVEKAEEVDRLLEDLKAKGFELIMGDVVTIEAAAKHHLEGILIQSGREAIFDAFQKAKSAFRLHERTQWEISFLQALLEETAANLAVLDAEGQVVYEQWPDYGSCPLPVEALQADLRLNREAEASVLIQEDGTRKLKQKRTLKVIQGKRYYLYTFSEMKQNGEAAGYHVEAVTQLPMLISQSEAMRGCLQRIENHLDSRALILIGEAGTGKQLLSRYIHYRKNEGRGLYVRLTGKQAVALSEKHENEAWDSDIRTLYIHGLDAIDPQEMADLKQWINVMKNRAFTMILSLEKDDSNYHPLLLDEEAARIAVPALRERKDDIKPLVTYYIASYHGTLGTSPIKIKDEAIQLLTQYDWPGNVSELKILLQDAVTEEKGYVIGKPLISRLLAKKEGHPSAAMNPEFLHGTLDEIEKRIIDAIMEEEQFNQTKVAERLGINRSTLWRKLKQ